MLIDAIIREASGPYTTVSVSHMIRVGRHLYVRPLT